MFKSNLSRGKSNWKYEKFEWYQILLLQISFVFDFLVFYFPPLWSLLYSKLLIRKPCWISDLLNCRFAGFFHKVQSNLTIRTSLVTAVLVLKVKLFLKFNQNCKRVLTSNDHTFSIAFNHLNYRPIYVLNELTTLIFVIKSLFHIRAIQERRRNP